MPTESPAGLAVEIDTGLRWRTVSADALTGDAAGDADVSRALIVMLRGLDALVEPDGGDQARTLARIEAKLDLVLLMLGRGAGDGEGLRHAQAGGHTPARAKLSPETLTWTAEGPIPPPGTRIEIELLLDPRAPFALCLPARVLDAAAAPAQEPPVITAQFTGLSDEARDALAARVFRLHRRAIQSQRAPD